MQNFLKRICSLSLVFVIIMIAGLNKVFGEGSPQFRPDTTKITYMMILNTQPTYGTFAGYSASDTNRLYIRINNPATEKIYFGMGDRSTATAWYFRVKDPNGNIVYGPTLLPTSGTGFIPYHSQAVAGPNTFNAQGYVPFVITPTAGVAGNYYIEFNQGSGTTVGQNKEISFGIFDVTVGIPSTNTVVQGRLFSYNWSFDTNSYANEFYGSFYIYGSDSSVTKIDMNGMKPYKFRISCNSYGALSTNNPTNNRRSQIGFHVPPELRLFLRDPDHTAFPSGSLQFLVPPITLSGCSRDSLCINLNLIKQSDVTILLDINGNSTYDAGTADRILFFPGMPAGPNCLFWNGKDGNGNYLPVASVVAMMVSVESGEVNLPIFDVESHPVGYTMSVVRPAGALFVDSLFYDDVLVGGSTSLAGCAFPCHTWLSNPANSETNTIGNNNTINSWWFARKQSINVSLELPDYLIVNAGADQNLCMNTSTPDSIQLSGSIAWSTSSYNGSKRWVTTGTGSFFPNDSVYNAKYIPSLADINAGLVKIYLRPQNGCDNPVDTMQVILKKRPVVGLAGTNVNCFGQLTGGITTTVSGSTAPYTFLWNNGSTSQNQAAIASGTYTVTVTSTNGCTTVSSTAITQPAAALAGSVNSISNVNCFGNSNGTIAIGVAGGTSPYTYLWSNGTTAQNLNGVAAGTYTVTITDARGCTAQSTGTISQPAVSLSATVSATQQVSCFGGNNGTLNLIPSGGTFPYTYLWSNGQITSQILNLSTGTYTVTVTDANNCTTVQQGTISQPSAALTSSAVITQQVSCFGGSNGAVNVTTSGGTAPYTFNWSNGSSSEDISGLAAGTYTLSITDAQGCTGTLSATILQPLAAISANASSVQQVACFGGNNGSATVAASGGTSPYTYSWSNGATSQNINGLISGNYTVTVTDNHGCSTTASASVNQPVSALNTNASISQQVSCFGGNNGHINLSASGGTSPYNYLWSNGSVAQNLANVPSGTYTVTVTDANGCTSQSSGTITQPALSLSVALNVSSQVYCYGGSNGMVLSTPAGGTSPYTYLWNNGATSQNLPGISSGTYTVTVTDANGCTAVQNAVVTQPSGPLVATPSMTQSVACFGGNTGSATVVASGGTSPYTYNWSNGSAASTITNLSSGIYTITVTDAYGCTTLNSTSVTQPAAAMSSSITSSQNVNCFGGNNGSVNLAVSGGTAPYSYNWSNGAATQDISNLASGSYTVTITDARGCTTSISVTISQPSGTLDVTTSISQNVSCFGGNNGAINLGIAGGTSPFTYNWSNGASSQNLSGLSTGTYTVTVTDANGCIDNATASVSQPAGALSSSLSVSQQVSCFGGNNGSINNTVSGGTAPFTYVWSNGATSQNINGLASGTYTVTITDANGCTTLKNTTVTQPTAAISGTLVMSQAVSCRNGSNGSLNLTVAGGTVPYTFVWSNGAITQDITGVAAGTYSVTVTDANGCTNNYSAIITQPAASLSSVANVSQQVSCFGGNNGSVILTVSGGTSPYSYIWSNGSATQNLSGVGTGTYSVTVTDANGCTTAQSATVTQPTAALATSAVINQNVSCFGGSNGSVNLSVNGGTSPYTYIWSNGQTTQDISGLAAGNYTVTVTDNNGCTTLRTVTISQPSAALSASATQSQAVSCNSGANGQMSLSVNGGTGPYTYVWNTGATTQAINGLASGTYTVTVTDFLGCTTTSSASITQPSVALSGSTTTLSNISCFSGNNGSIDLTVAGGTGPFVFMWNTGAITEDLSLLPAGSYSVTITDANGCTAQSSGVITQPAGSISANLNVSQNVACFGGGNGSLNLTVSGGTAPYNYTWSTGATTEDISGLAVGVYTVNITDANGCISSATGSITQPAAALSASVNSSQQVSCFAGNDGALNLVVNGGTAPYSYNWSNGASSQNINNLSTGTYIVTITDANGCTTIQSGVVTQPVAAVNATISSSNAVSCQGGSNGSINLTVTGGTSPYTFIWSNGQTTEDINGLSVGIYSVLITDVNGCNTNTTATITEPSAAVNITVNSTTAISCFGGNDGQALVSANGGTAPYTYLWNTGATTSMVNGLASGNYTITVTDVNGCSESAVVSLSQPVAALASSISVGQNVSCYGGNDGTADLTITGGTSPYTQLWSTGAVTEDVNGLANGTYTVTVTDANNCITTQTINITQPTAAMSASVTVTGNISCFSGNNGSVDLTVSGGTGPYSYNWNNGATTEDVSGLGAGTYTVTITDNNGCTEITTAQITQPAGSLAATLSVSQNVLCFSGNTGSLDLTVNGGTAPYSFIWNTGATNEDLNGLATGVYTVSITDANGCITSQSAFVNQPSAALSGTINGSINVSCFGGNTGNIDLNVIGGTSPYVFNWSNGETSEDITNLIAGTYSVSITDANGCITTASTTITEPTAALNTALTMTSQVNCFGGEDGAIDLTVTGGTNPYSYSWSTGDSTQDINNLMAGTYVVIVTDVNGCEATGQLTISQPIAPLLALIDVTSNVFCNGGSNGALDLSINGGTAPYTFNWNNGATTEDLSNLTTGIYTVTITDANGCTTTVTEGIGQPNQQLNATVSLQHVLCFNGNNGLVDITPSGGTAPYTFIWNTGSVSEDIGGLFAGTYIVTISDANGCDTVITASITQPAAPLIPTLTITQNVSCFGGSDGAIQLGVAGGTLPYVYLWNNGAVTTTISSLPAGAYTVTVTDANGCNAIISDFVVQPAAPLVAPITVSQPVSCYGGFDGSVIANPSGGTAPYTYVWNTGATTAGLSGLSTGTYSVTVTDNHGCTYSTSADVSQPVAPLNVTGSTTIANCLSGIGGTISINVTGGTPMYTFLWNDGSTAQNIADASPGAYTVTITDVNGCTLNASYVVGNNSTFSIMPGPTTICVGEVATLQADSIAGGTYQWYYAGSPLNGATSNIFITPAAGYYYVTVTIPCGTFIADSVEVIVKSVENASITNNQIICPPETVHLQATGGVTYEWTPSTFMTFNNIPDPIVNPTVNMTYSVLVTNEWGCTTSLKVDIGVACDTLFIPNGFSPNSDGTNDGFVIDHIDKYPGNKIWVYNRWGNLVFKTKNYDNKWDGVCNISGIYMGKTLPSGTYYFILDLNDNSKPRAGYLIIRR